MIEEYRSKLDAISEVLDSMPKNNVKNTNLFNAEVNKNIEEFKDSKIKVLNEINDRLDKINKKRFKPNLYDIKQNINNLVNKIYLLNEDNSSYEKTGFDVIIYSLEHFYKGNLNKVNEDILKLICIFKDVGVNLTEEDFYYTSYSYEYMCEFLKQDFNKGIDNTRMKAVFEKIYWKCPSVITHIELAFRYLYNKYKKKFDIYYLALKKKFLINENCTSEEIIEKLKGFYLRKDVLLLKDTATMLDEFLDGTLKLSDYSEKSIISSYKLFIDKDLNIKEYMSFNKDLNSLLNILCEYKSYKNFVYIVEHIREIVADKDKYTKVSSKMYKDISKKEKTLYKNNRKLNKFIKKNKEEKIDNTKGIINTLVNELSNQYKEYILNRVYEELVIKIDSTSTIYDILKYSYSYYNLLVSCIKSTDIFENVDDKVINSVYEELNNYLNNPYNTFIFNTPGIEEVDIPMIISDHYTLLNIKITKEMIVEGDIDNYIKNIQNILKYEMIMNSDISLNEVDYVVKTKIISKE